MNKVRVFRLRLHHSFLDEDEILLNDFLESVKVINVNTALVQDKQEPFWSVIVHYEVIDEELLDDYMKIQYDSTEPLSPEEEDLFFIIKLWRDNEAQKLRIIPSMILHNAHIKTIIKLRTVTISDLFRVKGLSKRKIEIFGEKIIALVGDYFNKIEK